MVDSADPHVLADWWAETLGWSVEPTDEDFIREMIAKGYAKEEETRTYRGALVWRAGAGIRHPDSPPEGPPRRILFQEVPEAKRHKDVTMKNPLHLDVWVGEANVEATLARLLERGATFLHRGRQGPHQWVTLQDPEGNEFCIS